MKIKILVEVKGRNDMVEIEDYSQNYKVGEHDYFSIPISKLQMFKEDNSLRINIRMENEEQQAEE